MLLPNWLFKSPLQRLLSFREPRFTYLEPGRLRDGELELIVPSASWLDALMASAQHPATRQNPVGLSDFTRRQLMDFISDCPRGHQTPRSSGMAPTYHFWMYNHDRPDLPIAGGVGLRVGHGADLELYYGHVGYHVYPPHRGYHFAERAVRLLMPLARRHGLDPLWITCNPDNIASRRTCERLGGSMVQTIAVPYAHPLFARGEVAKCRFRVDHVANVHRGRTS